MWDNYLINIINNNLVIKNKCIFILYIILFYDFIILDINECETVDNGGCDQRCVNYDGAYRCECYDGYMLRSGTCVGKFVIGVYVIYWLMASIVTCLSSTPATSWIGIEGKM